MKTTDLDIIVSLAQDAESANPIDWGMLAISEENALRLIASGLMDHFLTLDPPDRELVMMSTMTRLTVENMVLNLKLLGFPRTP